MLARIHVLNALVAGWKAIAESRDNFRSIFANDAVIYTDGVDLAGNPVDPYIIVDRWYDALCPDGKAKYLRFDSMYLHSRTPIPCVVVGTGAAQQNEKTLGQNTRADKAVLWHLRHAITLTLYTEDSDTADALSVILCALMGMSGEWLIKTAGYRDPELVQVRDLEPLPDRLPEKIGVFRKVISWSMNRDHAYAPLLGAATTPGYLSLHHYDALDRWGNPGRVTTKKEG